MKQVQGCLNRLFLRANGGSSSSLIQSGEWLWPDVKLGVRTTKMEANKREGQCGQHGSVGEAPA